MDLNNSKKSRRKNNVDLSTIVYGKVPPQARELEEAVLGALLLEKSAYYEINGILRDICFYVDAHQRIFRSIIKLHEKRIPVDILTVIENLKESEELEMIGGPYYLTRLTNSVVSSANIQQHAKKVFEKFIQREVIRISGQLIGDAYEDSTVDPFELIDNSVSQLKAISDILTIGENVKVSDVCMEILNDLHTKVYYAKQGIPNPKDIYTRIPEWDRINGPLFPGLYVIAGRPGMGKGVHLTECICRMAKEYNIGVINGEMTNKQLMIRVGCNLLEINNRLWKKKAEDLTDTDIAEVAMAMEEAQTLKLFIDDKRNIELIRTRIRYWVLKCGVKCVFIDFLGLLGVSADQAKYKNETEVTNYVLEILRELCKDLEVTIILYVQLNRDLYKSGTKEPNLSHLKQSGKIEEYAFQVSFLHRPEYYDPQNAVDEMGQSIKGLMKQIIAKHRDGEMETLSFFSRLECSKLESWGYSPVPGFKPSDAPF
jgi:replicative DNA helicase